MSVGCRITMYYLPQLIVWLHYLSAFPTCGNICPQIIQQQIHDKISFPINQNILENKRSLYSIRIYLLVTVFKMTVLT